MIDRTEPVVRATGLHRFFRSGRSTETAALRDVSLEVAAGELVAVAGPSGSGKSTLLACLAGIDTPDAGTVHVAGHAMTGATEAGRARLRARYLGMVLQTGNLIEHLTVAENVVLTRGLARGPARDPARGPDRRATDGVAALLGSLGLTARARHRPSSLSGGEAARAGLAVALANDPVVLLADEPTGELDSRTEDGVLDLLGALARRGTAVLVASHSAAVAGIADRTVTLRDGWAETDLPACAPERGTTGSEGGAP